MNKLKIELGGKVRTLRFNILFAKELGVVRAKLDEDEGVQNINNTGIFIYAALKADSKLTGDPMELSYADCYDIAEEMILKGEVDKMQQINEAYTSSTAYTFLEEVKKKAAEMEASPQIGMPLEDTLTEN